MPQRTLIRNEEKQASGFKAGETDWLTLFANAVIFMIKTALISRVAKPGALKEKDKHQLPVFFPHWFHEALSLKYPATQGPPFKVLLTFDNAPGLPHKFSIEDIDGIYLPPNTMSQILPLDQGLRLYMNMFRKIKKTKNNPDTKSPWVGLSLLPPLQSPPLYPGDSKSSPPSFPSSGYSLWRWGWWRHLMRMRLMIHFQ